MWAWKLQILRERDDDFYSLARILRDQPRFQTATYDVLHCLFCAIKSIGEKTVFFLACYRHIVVRSFGFKALENIEVQVTSICVGILIDKTNNAQVNFLHQTKNVTKSIQMGTQIECVCNNLN